MYRFKQTRSTITRMSRVHRRKQLKSGCVQVNIRDSLNNLFPNKDPEHKLSVKEMNKRARAKADKEELAKMEYVKHLNYVNKKNRTGGLRKYDI